MYGTLQWHTGPCARVHAIRASHVNCEDSYGNVSWPRGMSGDFSSPGTEFLHAASAVQTTDRWAHGACAEQTSQVAGSTVSQREPRHTDTETGQRCGQQWKQVRIQSEIISGDNTQRHGPRVQWWTQAEKKWLRLRHCEYYLKKNKHTGKMRNNGRRARSVIEWVHIFFHSHIHYCHSIHPPVFATLLVTPLLLLLCW